MKRRNTKGYGLEASEFKATPEMLRIAKERTQDILGVWGSKLRWGHDTGTTIQQLAESCYMQGVNDTMDVITQTEVLKHLQKMDEPAIRNLPA
jgi:hypothetical protein